MTFEAKQAIREIQTHIFGIDGKMEFLTEPALKGFAFEARRLAENDLDNAVWRGIAEAADRRRENSGSLSYRVWRLVRLGRCDPLGYFSAHWKDRQFCT